MRKAILLVMLMLTAPFLSFTNAETSPYTGSAQLIVSPTGTTTLTNISEDSFQIPANTTILDGWVNISTGASGDGGTGTQWVA
ncbi:MAG: hypothetical protein QF440_01785, partial [Candidatus Thalassarchaeaceae archaeon]|nr:hypothetical protein [Candidatus Thalassarchaeaceae archaeon]